MCDIKIYKTNVPNHNVASSIRETIQLNFPECTLFFDLEDRDKVLKIVNETSDIREPEILNIIRNSGYSVEPLP